MRLLLAALAILFALLAPSAQAQLTPGPVVQAELQVDSEPIAAGNATVLRLTLVRLCPNAATVYDAQTARVTIATNDLHNWTVAGPMQGHFPQQLCAQQMEQPIEMTYEIRAGPDAAADDVRVHPFSLRIQLDHSSPTTPASGDVHYPFALSTQARPMPPPVVEGPERESPGPGLVAAILALAAVGAAARRR